ncbi:MAG: HAMP domain-containing histidine kinase [Proteobacteria bacterium]|nr:HAMP domain-containing histidine kinase [Pseudomonadota bacterium]
MRRPRSLWWRAIFVALLVACAPMVFIWVSNLTDATVGDQMLAETEDATARVEQVLTSRHNRARQKIELEGIARSAAVRVRVVDEAGEVVHDIDHDLGDGLMTALAGLFFAPDDAPTLADYDADLPLIDKRLEIGMARARGSAGGCEHSPAKKLLVCHHARRVGLEDGTVVIYSQESSRRAIRALYDLRYQMLKLTMFQVGFAVLLGVWLGWRIVRPIETLRRQVRARTQPRVSTQPVHIDRDDEIGDLAGAFNELLAALRQRNDDYQSFVEDLAHEMKNPVAAIRVASERLDGPVDEQRAKRLSRVLKDSSQRLDDLVTRFLELARAEAGLKDAARERVDLSPLIRALVEELSARFPEQTHHADVPDEAWVIGAPSQLETALRNLLNNAADFAGDGGIVRVLVLHDGPAFRIAVRDSGDGVAPEDREKVFERFFTRRSGRGGTGLGLAMTRAVVEAHGGSVIVADPVDDDAPGAHFSVSLPRELTPSERRSIRSGGRMRG